MVSKQESARPSSASTSSLPHTHVRTILRVSPEQRGFFLSLPFLIFSSHNTLHRPYLSSSLPFPSSSPHFHFTSFSLTLYTFIFHLQQQLLHFHSMASSSDNLAASIESWMYRPAMTDTWLSDYIARDAETLTKALHKSLSSSSSPEDALSPFLNLIKTDSATTTTTTVTTTAATTPTVSSLSGSDDSAPKRQRVAAGKISKRKSRASKRSQTTFITADPANFRQMVQQVTGVRFGSGSNVSMVPLVKPEPHRAVGVNGGGRFTIGGGCLPTLDTSAFLLQHHQQQQQTMVGPNSDGPEMTGLGPLSFGQPIGEDASGFGSAGLDFETFSSCFPTLESSWKVM